MVNVWKKEWHEGWKLPTKECTLIETKNINEAVVTIRSEIMPDWVVDLVSFYVFILVIAGKTMQCVWIMSCVWYGDRENLTLQNIMEQCIYIFRSVYICCLLISQQKGYMSRISTTLYCTWISELVAYSTMHIKQFGIFLTEPHHLKVCCMFSSCMHLFIEAMCFCMFTVFTNTKPHDCKLHPLFSNVLPSCKPFWV